MSVISKIVDEAIDGLEKLDMKLKEAESEAKEPTKGRIGKLRETVKNSIDDLKQWKQKPKAAQALDVLKTILDRLAEELPPPAEQFVKAYLTALLDSMPVAYQLAYKRFKNNLVLAQDHDNPSEDEIDEAARDATNNRDDQNWLKLMWRMEQIKKKVVDEGNNKTE